jgi:hypothetical protein
MYCRKCGTQNIDNAFKCISCGNLLHEGTSPLMQQQIPNYLVQAILVTLFCCLPLGIPAIVFAAQVNSKVQAGDIQGAMDSSGKAKLWTWLAFGLGIVFFILYILFSMLAVVAESANNF